MSQLPGPSHEFGRGVIPIEADLAPLEAQKREVERIAEEFGAILKEKALGPLSTGLDAIEQRFDAIQAKIAAASQPTTPAATVEVQGTNRLEILEARVATVDATLNEILDKVTDIANSPALQREPD